MSRSVSWRSLIVTGWPFCVTSTKKVAVSPGKYSVPVFRLIDMGLGLGKTVNAAVAVREGKPVSAFTTCCPSWASGTLNVKLNAPLPVEVNPMNWSSKLRSICIAYGNGVWAAGNPLPVTVTLVPCTPLVGLIVMVGGGRIWIERVAV